MKEIPVCHASDDLRSQSTTGNLKSLFVACAAVVADVAAAVVADVAAAGADVAVVAAQGRPLAHGGCVVVARPTNRRHHER